MKKSTYRLIIILCILLLSLAVLASCVPIRSKTVMNILLLPVEKKFETDIEFKSSAIWLPAHISIDGISVIEESGRLYYFDTIDIYYNITDLVLKREVFFKIKGIRLYQDMQLLNSVANMLDIPKTPDIEFEKMEGLFQLRNNGTLIKHFYAHNDRMRIRGSGWVDREGSLDCDVNFSFSKEVTGKIPDVVRSTLLKDERGGWMGITLKAKGNYKRPSLHIIGDVLKINIKELF